MIQGLYIHIPFCLSICSYCDFVKLIGSESLQQDYMDSLIRELRTNAHNLAAVRTIYIGGGTPSCLKPELLAPLFRELAMLPAFPAIEEYTIEANPGDIDFEMAMLFKRAGITRVSLGVQTFSERLLEPLRRRGGYPLVMATVANLRKAGIPRLNLDLIYGLPGQTDGDVRRDLESIRKIHPEHLSYYQLILEEKTELAHLIRSGSVHLPDEDDVYRMGKLIEGRLESEGYQRYEISNYALPGQKSRHNLLYWNLEEYLGIGMGAASQYAAKRFRNHDRIRAYLTAVQTHGSGLMQEEPFEPDRETLILGLRKLEGIDMLAFAKDYGKPVLEMFPKLRKHLAGKLLMIQGTRLCLTETGLDLMNQVLMALD